MSPNHADGGPAYADGDTFEETHDERSRMSFLEHLDELRRRILYSVYALVASCAVTFYWWQDMFVYLTSYFHQYGGTLIFTRPMGGFMFSLKISALAGLLIASPFIFTQLWLFVAPGLYAREKKVVVPFVFFSTLFFIGGAAFAHLVAFPAMWKFFASYEIAGLQYFPTIDETFSLYVKTIIGMGLVFQLPMLVFFLSRFGIVTAKFMITKFKYAFLGIFIIAALITPSADVVTQLIFAAPMLALYLISIAVAWLFGKKREEAA
ncbi:MAG: twin-arginine translocase subunit TatC [Vicinamibacterales bacterium]